MIVLIFLSCFFVAENAPYDAYAAFMANGSSKRDHGGDSGGTGGGGIDESDRHPRGGKYSGGEYSVPPISQEVALNEDNEGHKLLKRMGWQEGSGLGIEGSGIIEPIRETVKKDKTGIGSSSQSNGPATEFSSYRSQLSSDYHSRTTWS